MDNMKGLFDGSQTQWTNLYKKWTLFMFSVILVMTANYVATTPGIVNSHEWTVNILAKCPNVKIE